MRRRIGSHKAGLLAAGAVIAMAPCLAHAALAVVRNGVTWNGTYEGDVAPPTASTPAWSNFDVNGSATASSDGNIYTSNSPSVTATNSYVITTGFTSGTARTLEFRVKVDANAAEAGDGAIQFIPAVDGYFMAVSVGKHFVALNQGGSFIAQDTSVDNTADFNTYRVTVDRSLSTDIYKLYMNNNSTPILTSGASTGQYAGADYDEVIFGDTSAGGSQGISYTDFVSWTDQGAFAPTAVPEPASLAVVALGGLFFRRRAR